MYKLVTGCRCDDVEGKFRLLSSSLIELFLELKELVDKKYDKILDPKQQLLK